MPTRATASPRRDNRSVLRVGRLLVALIGTVEAGYFGFAALYLVLYVFAGWLDGVWIALVAVTLAASALAGAAGVLGRRRWGGVLVAAVSGLGFVYLLVAGSSIAWVLGTATIFAAGYAIALWRVRPSAA